MLPFFFPLQQFKPHLFAVLLAAMPTSPCLHSLSPPQRLLNTIHTLSCTFVYKSIKQPQRQSSMHAQGTQKRARRKANHALIPGPLSRNRCQIKSHLICISIIFVVSLQWQGEHTSVPFFGFSRHFCFPLQPFDLTKWPLSRPHSASFSFWLRPFRKVVWA